MEPSSSWEHTRAKYQHCCPGAVLWRVGFAHRSQSCQLCEAVENATAALSKGPFSNLQFDQTRQHSAVHHWWASCWPDRHGFEAHQRAWGRADNNTRAIKVPCQPLERLLVTQGFKDGGATFLSLDVEGAEELVLSTARPSAFKLIMVELDGTNLTKDENVRKHILSDGNMRVLPTLTSHIKNSNEVFARYDVREYPLPATWRTVARLGRARLAPCVTASALAGLLNSEPPSHKCAPCVSPRSSRHARVGRATLGQG